MALEINEPRNISLKKLGPGPTDWKIATLDGGELPPVAAFKIEVDINDLGKPPLTLEVCSVGEMDAVLPARWKVDPKTLELMAKDNGFELVRADAASAPKRTLWVAHDSFHKRRLADQLLEGHPERGAHRYHTQDKSLMVVEPGEALTGLRFDVIYMPTLFFHADLAVDGGPKSLSSAADRARRQEWLDHAVRCRLVPDGKLIWL